MTRVHVFVEGQTEETFVRELLYDPLVHRGVFLNPILLRTSAGGRGGVVSYGKIRNTSTTGRKQRHHEQTKVTIKLSSETVAYFTAAADKHHMQYQKMIEQLHRRIRRATVRTRSGECRCASHRLWPLRACGPTARSGRPLSAHD